MGRPHSPFHAPSPLKPSSARNSGFRVSLASRLGFTAPGDPNNKEAEANSEEKDADVESNGPIKESLERPLVFISAIFVGLAMCLIIILLLGFGGSALLYQSLVDGNWMRMALLASTPFFGLFGLVSWR